MIHKTRQELNISTQLLVTVSVTTVEPSKTMSHVSRQLVVIPSWAYLLLYIIMNCPNATNNYSVTEVGPIHNTNTFNWRLQKSYLLWLSPHVGDRFFSTLRGAHQSLVKISILLNIGSVSCPSRAINSLIISTITVRQLQKISQVVGYQSF